jgi:hypothetical protein
MSAVALVPPSGLPAISPTRGEITSGMTVVLHKSPDHDAMLIGTGERAPSRSPPLWGRCPAGQRGVPFRNPLKYGVSP